PSLAGMLAADPDARAAIAKLRCFLIGGEALPAALARDLAAIVEGEIINMYGPTETTIWSSTHRVSNENGLVPIGRPVANTRIYVRDSVLESVIPGAAGELVIGGEGVARGYLRRQDLTSERFVPDPFGGGRLYRTGDRAGHREGGVLEFLGRID